MNSYFKKNEIKQKEKMNIEITPELLEEIHDVMEKSNGEDLITLEKSKMTIVRIESNAYKDLSAEDPIVPIPDYSGFVLTF
jgi:hypothetical protein